MDVYYSELKPNKGWQEPQSLGYPINKTRNDVQYYIASGDKRFYSSLTDNNSMICLRLKEEDLILNL